MCRKVDPTKYGTNGRATLTKYVQSCGHVQREFEKLTSYILGSGAAKHVEENHGAPPMFSMFTKTKLPYITTLLELQIGAWVK